MHQMFNFLQTYAPYWIFMDTLLLLILLALYLSNLSRVKSLERLLSFLGEGENWTDLKRLLSRQQSFMAETERHFRELSKTLDELRELQRRDIQRVGFIRFDAFRDVGGELSFSLALLNDKKEGVVISSLYGREGARVYAKPIKEGTSPFPLSDEEKEAIRRALGD